MQEGASPLPPALKLLEEHRVSDTVYSLCTSADGSPTLIMANANDPQGEAMHHSAGALGETLYVYKPALEAAFGSTNKSRVLIVGLGLGYIEMVAAALGLQQGYESFHLISMEAAPALSENFSAWLLEKEHHVFFGSAFDQALLHVASHFKLALETLKASLRKFHESNRWELRGALDDSTNFEHTFECVCFDAFSRGTSPELWSERFLKRFVEAHASPTCVFATYASTGRLKAVLKGADFELTDKAGYQGKRECTFALRDMHL